MCHNSVRSINDSLPSVNVLPSFHSCIFYYKYGELKRDKTSREKKPEEFLQEVLHHRVQPLQWLRGQRTLWQHPGQAPPSTMKANGLGQMKRTFSIINAAKTHYTPKSSFCVRWSIEEIGYNDSKVSDRKNIDKTKEMQPYGHAVPHQAPSWTCTDHSAHSLNSWPLDSLTILHVIHLWLEWDFWVGPWERLWAPLTSMA